MSKLRVAIVIGLLGLVLTGCGGGGGTNRDVVEQWILSFGREAEQQDINGIAALISDDYLADCDLKADVVAVWQAIFDSSDTIDIIDVLITAKVIDDVNGIATFSIVFTARTVEDGVATDWVFESDAVLIRENGVWREYGDQSC